MGKILLKRETPENSPIINAHTSKRAFAFKDLQDCWWCCSEQNRVGF